MQFTFPIELLAPARDLRVGRAAIAAGADAVYIGAPRFGARARVGNPLVDIAALIEYAHTYWARVYIALNTLLYDDELPAAVELAHQLYALGADALIIQDMGLLESALPPIPLIASTQTHNATPEKVAFLEQVGFSRVILARELSLTELCAIRAQTSVELETFVHGALCVSYSGQCYLSYAVGGRSGNRGECAQPCRRCYDLVDANGKSLAQGKHLLSLKDLNLSAHLGDLLDAGITSFKIEGRLKDVAYVTNVVSAYRQALDPLLAARGLKRSSSGRSAADFTPDLSKTFNRGYTAYFLHGRGALPGSIETPKMVGEPVGRVATVGKMTFGLEAAVVTLHSGDGLSFFDATGELRGTVVNRVEGLTITPNSMESIRPGLQLYRNHDHTFLQAVERAQVTRAIAVSMVFAETSAGFALTVTDEDGISATATLNGEKVLAQKPELAEKTIRQQLVKTGDSIFACAEVSVTWAAAYFLPVGALNALRRDALAQLLAARAAARPCLAPAPRREDFPYPATALTFESNVLNARAAAFYRKHNVTTIEPAAESGLELAGRRVMRTRYCILRQLGACRQTTRHAGPLFLVDEAGRKYELRFDCAACEMEVWG